MLFTFQRSFLRSITNVYRTNLPELASGLHSDDGDVTIRADQRATGAPPDTITVDLQSFRHFYSLTSKRLGAPPSHLPRTQSHLPISLRRISEMEVSSFHYCWTSSVIIIMHVVLAIFLRLAVFLVLVQALPCIIGSITVFVHAAYVKSAFLRIFFPNAPYRTLLCNATYTLYHLTSHVFTFAFPQKWSQKPAVSQREPSSDVVRAHSGGLSVDTLRWLLSASSDLHIQDIVMQFICGLSMLSKPGTRSSRCQ
ncbi:hypothetical protein ARMSODRAFT_666934 [Armillaria solidipes]|uniref:Uncharacterized protein n=1 Tax=Armillaria solidipes TaxID=1076256 RepID=A0A2H3AR72_9AGAR|nr:hypothetical protein ARMSODRAFT_666934 [Armillaria solidipes]